MQEILNRIEQTAGMGTSFIFKHLIITVDEMECLLASGLSIEKFATENNIDFISLKKFGKVEVLHITSTLNKQSIHEKGLLCNRTVGWINDLGIGLYGVDKDNETGLENLRTYVEGHFDDDDMLIVEADYTGEYIQCIYGYGHEGYIVLKVSIPAQDVTDIISSNVDDFLCLSF